MVNLGLNLSSLLGIILAVAGAGLYFLRSWRPKLARDHDIFFAAVGLALWRYSVISRMAA